MQLRSKFSTLDNNVIVKSNTTWNVGKYLLFSNYNCSSKNVMFYEIHNAFTGILNRIKDTYIITNHILQTQLPPIKH